MRILIVEHEDHAYRRLKTLLAEIAPEARIAGRCRNISQSLHWLKTHAVPDLIFSAVQLPDGLSFEIFRTMRLILPVIFICRLDKYALDAFKANGIHYLAKPIQKKDLQEALAKYQFFFQHKRVHKRKNSGPLADHSSFQKRFIVHVGKQMKLVPVDDIAYFFTENKIVYLVTYHGDKYSIDFTLEELEKMLDPRIFFRANRQFITGISSIVRMAPASKSRLELSLKPQTKHDIITSFDRTSSFRKWLVGA